MLATLSLLTLTRVRKSLNCSSTYAPFYSHAKITSLTLRQRIMGYIDSGKQDGAKVAYGGERHGDSGYFIKPTIFTDASPDMKIVQEEIFGPVGVVIKFTDEEGVFSSRSS